MGGPRRPVAAAVAVAAAIACAGCAQGESGVELTVTSDMAVPGDMDEVRVEARPMGRSGRTFTTTRRFPLGTADDRFVLPVTVVVRRGSAYDLWVEFHVTGLKGRAPIVDRWAYGYFPGEGVARIGVHLTDSCRYASVACDDGFQCVDGRCLPIEHPEAPGADADADADGDAGADEAGEAEADAEAGDGDTVASDGDAGDGAPDGGSCTVGDFPVQAECASGFKCTFAEWAGTTVLPICDPDGTGGNNDLCTDADPPAASDTCAAYYYCYPDLTESRCRRFCSTDADCAAAHGTAWSGCDRGLLDGEGHALEGVRMCTTGCDPHSDDDCDLSQACRPFGDSAGISADCSPLGSGIHGASCALAGAVACARRHVCLSNPVRSDIVRCSRFCFSHDDCAEVGVTSKCIVGVVTADGSPIPGFRTCSDQCDPLDDTVCDAGTVCRYVYDAGDYGLASYCGRVGPGGQGDACASMRDCRAGFDCCSDCLGGSGPACVQACRKPSGSPSCPAGLACGSGFVGLPGNYGFCS